MTLARASSLALIVWLILAGGCMRLPVTAIAPIKAKNAAELKGYLNTHKAELDLFKLQGPFSVTEHKDHVLRLSAKERIKTDLFLASAPEKAPLLIFLHGYESTKEAHEYQARHVATWGLHAMTVQLPNRGPWSTNGRTLARIAEMIHRLPAMLDDRIDPNRIILVGHSFGASAVSVALGEGAPVAGGILLDPAAIGRELPKFLRQIDKPVLVLGADHDVSSSRNRDYFYEFVRARIAEVSIRDASHEDGQYPSEYALHNFGEDPHTSEDAQITFAAAIVSGALSLAASGTFDYAWQSFGTSFGSGKLIDPRKK